MSVMSTLCGGYSRTEVLDLSDRVDGRVVPVVIGERWPLVSRRDLAAGQQRNMACAAFGQIGGHDATEGSPTTGDDVGRIGREFRRESLRQARAWAKPWDEHGVTPDGNLILGVLREDVLADT